ncbi:MAG: hypothetical protein QM541_12440, partial [Flavobacterium sp.]|nr:hypothetical protein [Flavobacterium sp.]
KSNFRCATLWRCAVVVSLPLWLICKSNFRCATLWRCAVVVSLQKLNLFPSLHYIIPSSNYQIIKL